MEFDKRAALSQQMGDAWKQFRLLAQQFGPAIKARQVLTQEQLCFLVAGLKDLEDTIRQASLTATYFVRKTMYAIAIEGSEAGQYLGFTHGPVAEMEELMGHQDVTNGQVLVAIHTGQGHLAYQGLKGFLDGKWYDLDEQPRAVTTAS